MKKSLGKIIEIARGIAMLAFGQIAVENRNKISVIEESPAKGIEQRGKPADRGCPNKTPVAEHTMGFAQSSDTIVSFGKVIQRAKQ